MSEFLSMGGYAEYVWSAMAAAAVLMLLEPMLLMMKRKAVLQEIKRGKRLAERQKRDNER